MQYLNRAARARVKGPWAPPGALGECSEFFCLQVKKKSDYIKKII